MCGIGGIKKIGPKPISKDSIDLLLCSLEERGNDATGIALVGGAGIKIVKSDTPAWKFVTNFDGYKEFMAENFNDSIHTVLVHTRLATKGNPRNNENNHPLSHDKSAIVHNGVISNDDYLFQSLRLTRHAETDSDILRAIIDEWGLTQKGIRQLDKICGSVACAVVHPEFPNHLLLLRSGSPLTVGWADGFLYWASELRNIQYATKQWDKKFGILMQKKQSDLYFTPMPTNTAWLFGPNGLKWHQEFKTANHTSVKYNRNIYKTYKTRQETWDRKIEEKTEAKTSIIKVSNAKYNRCAPRYICKTPGCEQVCWIPAELMHMPLSGLKCKHCQKTLENAVLLKEI